MKNITELKGGLKGNDVYVIASGPSAGYVDPEFFSNKWSIGVNEVYRRFDKLDFLLRKEAARAGEFAEAARHIGAVSVISRYDCGMYSRKLNPDVCDYVFDHPDNQRETIDLSPVGSDDDRLVVSYSTITSAIHLAAYLGAANIILVGHDCGRLDGGMNFPVYPPSLGGADFYRRWLPAIEPQTLALRARLHEVYGCRVYSLNPFINFGLEGHVYER